MVRPAELKISVITVCLNSFPRVRTAVESVLAQRHGNWELVVVDGGSTDGTVDYFASLSDPRILFRSEQDGGIYQAMNKGVARAGGDLLLFLNSDDAVYHPQVFEEAAGIFARSRALDVVYGDAEYFFSNGAIERKAHPDVLTLDFFRLQGLCHQAMFIKRTAFAVVGAYDERFRLLADYDWLLRSLYGKGLNYYHANRLFCRAFGEGLHMQPQSGDLVQREKLAGLNRNVPQGPSPVFPANRLMPSKEPTPDPAPQVTVFTRPGAGEDAADLAAVYEALKRQTWRRWNWVILGEGKPGPWDEDPKVSRGVPEWWGSASIDSAYFCWLPATAVLRPATLEKWVWFLERHPSFLLIDGAADLAEGEVAGRFLDAGKAQASIRYELPFLSRSRLATLIPEPRQVTSSSLWFYALRAQPGSLGWSLIESVAHFTKPPVPAPLNQGGNEALARYFQGDPAPRQPLVRTFRAVPSELGWNEALDLPPAPRRVLMILPKIEINGAATFNLNLAWTLVKEGWSIHIVTTEKHRPHLAREFEALTDDVFHLAHFLDPHDFAGFVRSLMASRGIERVFTSETHIGKYLVPLLRRWFPQAAFLDYCHVRHLDERPDSHPGQTVALLPQLDLAVVTSRNLRQWMLDAGAASEPGRVEVCYIGVDTDYWRREKASAPDGRVLFGLDPKRPVLLYACRLVEQKNPQVFAETVRQLVQEDGIDLQALVIGSGPAQERLRQALEQGRVLDRVVFGGLIDAEQMREAYAMADVFFLPSRWEGISMGLYEAMAMGLPSVMTEVGGQAELLTAECGHLLPLHGDLVRNCRGALRDLLQNPERRQAMGAAARKRIEAGFGLELAGKRMIALFQRAAELQKSAPRESWPEAAARELIRQEIALCQKDWEAYTHWSERQQADLRHQESVRRIAALEAAVRKFKK